MMYHLRHPHSTTKNPRTLCGVDPDFIKIQPDSDADYTHMARMTEWEWVRGSFANKACKGMCPMCVQVAQQANIEGLPLEALPTTSANEVLPF